MKSWGIIKPQELIGRFFIGKIIGNDDPLKMERIQVRVPYIFDDCSDENLPWAIAIKQRLQGATSVVGSFGVPVVGTDVVVAFEKGDRNSPMYFGSLLTSEDLIAVFGVNYPSRYGFKDSAGNIFYVDTSTNDVHFEHASGTTLDISPSGAVTINAADNVTVNTDGNATINSDGDVSVTAGGNSSLSAGGDVSIDSGGNVTVTAALQVTVTSGTTIELNP